MEPSGVIILNKPAGMTSHDCVNKMRRLFDTKKVGHTGTLDPMATGVLPILIGRAAKAADLLTAENKLYRAGLRLGLTTDTEDTTGNTLSTSDSIPDEATVRSVCATFVGGIMQIPPMYSALKVGGQKLVDLARRGVTIEREARPITINSIVVESTSDPTDYILTIDCSKGTYIRTLCANIGEKLGCGGCMSSLERLGIGNFKLADSVTIEYISEFAPEERQSLLRPVESLFYDLPELILPEFFERLSRNGCEVYLKKLGLGFPVGTRVRLCGSEGFYALGEVMEFENGPAVKAIKLFEL